MSIERPPVVDDDGFVSEQLTREFARLLPQERP